MMAQRAAHTGASAMPGQATRVVTWLEPELPPPHEPALCLPSHTCRRGDPVSFRDPGHEQPEAATHGKYAGRLQMCQRVLLYQFLVHPSRASLRCVHCMEATLPIRSTRTTLLQHLYSCRAMNPAVWRAICETMQSLAAGPTPQDGATSCAVTESAPAGFAHGVGAQAANVRAIAAPTPAAPPVNRVAALGHNMPQRRPAASSPSWRRAEPQLQTSSSGRTVGTASVVPLTRVVVAQRRAATPSPDATRGSPTRSDSTDTDEDVAAATPARSTATRPLLRHYIPTVQSDSDATSSDSD